MPLSLSVFGSNVAATTLTTAGQLSTTTGGTQTVSLSLCGTSFNFGEVYALGNTSAWAASGSIGSPSDNGWLLDTTTLEGTSIIAGNWTFSVAISVTGSGSRTADLWIRAYKRASSGVYTQIGALSLTGQSITTTRTVYTFAVTALPLMAFGTGDKLYLDFWVKITGVTGGLSTDRISCYLSNSGTVGLVNDIEAITPGTGTPVFKDVAARANVLKNVYKDIVARANVTHTAFKDVAARANVMNPLAPSWVSQYTFKTQVVQVYNQAGAFLDTLYDAPLLAGFKEAINTAPSQLQVSLPRSFSNYNPAPRPATLVLGNVVQYYLFGPGLPATGLLRYQGVIDSIVPEIAESGAETVTITITPQGSVVEDTGFVGPVNFGTAGNPGTYVDTVTQFNYFFTTTYSRKSGIPVGGPGPLTPAGLPTIPPAQGVASSYCSPLYLDPTNPASSGNKTQYSYSNQKISSIFDAILTMDPPNWFYRINPNLSVTHNVPPTTAQHLFLVGSHLVNPQVSQSVQLLKNDIIVNGAKTQTATTSTPTITSSSDKPGINFSNPGTSGESASLAHNPVITSSSSTPTTTLTTTQITANSMGSDISTYNDRVLPYSDPRVTDSTTASTIAGGILTITDRVTTRAKVRLVDYRGDNQIGLGYDIESIKVGDTCQILDTTPQNVSTTTGWALRSFGPPVPFQITQQNSSAVTGVVVITALTYNFYSIDLELDTPQPNFMHALNVLKRNVDRITMT